MSDGVPIVCMDYKEMVKGRPVHVILRERDTGYTCGIRCLQEGASDEWLVRRLAVTLGNRGLRECALWIKSDGELAMRALQAAVKGA